MDKIAVVEGVLIGLSHLTAIFSAAFTLCTSELSVTFSSSLLEFLDSPKDLKSNRRELVKLRVNDCDARLSSWYTPNNTISGY